MRSSKAAREICVDMSHIHGTSSQPGNLCWYVHLSTVLVVSNNNNDTHIPYVLHAKLGQRTLRKLELAFNSFSNDSTMALAMALLDNRQVCGISELRRRYPAGSLYHTYQTIFSTMGN